MDNTKFNEKELKRLKCTDEEIKLVLEYQKKLPIINDLPSGDAVFCINARKLHSQLEVGRDFSTWVKSRIDKYSFSVNKDYIVKYESDVTDLGDIDFSTLSPNQMARHGIRCEYYLTINVAKELCVIENNPVGKIARKYFILMEDIIKRNEEWWTTRMPQRKNYKPMCEALSEKLYELCGRYGDKFDFSREANILNIIATGVKSQDIRLYLDIYKNELTRDSLENEYNEKIAFLQEQNILLINTDMKILDRVKLLITFFDTKYPNAKPLIDYKTREDMINARNELLDSLKR